MQSARDSLVPIHRRGRGDAGLPQLGLPRPRDEAFLGEDEVASGWLRHQGEGEMAEVVVLRRVGPDLRDGRRWVAAGQLEDAAGSTGGDGRGSGQAGAGTNESGDARVLFDVEFRNGVLRGGIVSQQFHRQLEQQASSPHGAELGGIEDRCVDIDTFDLEVMGECVHG